MRFGLPRVITSDQGREFNNELNRELAKRLGIDHRLTTSYHPQVTIVREQCSIDVCIFRCPVMSLSCILIYYSHHLGSHLFTIHTI